MTIDVRDHKELLVGLLKKYNIPENSLEIVPSVQEWCKKNRIEEENPFRIAKCICNSDSGNCHILLIEEISDEMANSAKGAMDYRGFDNEVSLLDTGKKFLAHVMLHEIACKVLGTTKQETRDRWAFEELKKIVPD